MSARSWQVILAAWADTDRIIGASLPGGAGVGEAGLDARLSALRGDLSGRLGKLIADLRAILTAEARAELGLDARGGADEASARAAAGADDEVEQTIVPLALHLDERVLGRLPPALRTSWTRLQEDVIHSDDGGEVFFTKLDALLASATPPALVLEAYLFCLSEGFFGQYLDEPEQITRYKDRIVARLPRATSASTSTSAMTTATTTMGTTTATNGGGGGGGGGKAMSRTRPTTAPPKVLPAVTYYAIAAVAALILIFALRALVG